MPARRPARLSAAVLVAAGAWAAGRPGHPDDPFPPRPDRPLYPVSGAVRWNGRPAAHARVYLYPLDDRHPGRWPNGYPRAVAAADGSFAVSTFRLGDGAPAGRYAALVRWPTHRRRRDDDDTPRDRFAGRHADPAAPPAVVVVAAGRPTDVRIALTD